MTTAFLNFYAATFIHELLQTRYQTQTDTDINVHLMRNVITVIFGAHHLIPYRVRDLIDSGVIKTFTLQLWDIQVAINVISNVVESKYHWEVYAILWWWSSHFMKQTNHLLLQQIQVLQLLFYVVGEVQNRIRIPAPILTYIYNFLGKKIVILCGDF